MTSPSTLRLSEVARHVIVPEGITSTGWAAVEARCAEWGDSFDLWQADTGRLTLGKRETGEYAAGVGGVGWSIPRQVVKTFLAGRIVFALCTLFPNLTVLWTAHHGKTVARTFGSMAALAERKAAKYIKPNGVRRGNGDQAINFVNGSEIIFGAREHGFGRGFAEVDIEVFDEAQILKEDALEDMVAATNSSKFPAGGLLLYMGTPPRPKDPGFVFKQRRKEALAGGSPDGLYIECSADKDGDHDDPAQWAIANPSYRLGRVSHSAMLRLRKNLLSDGSWRREGLGVWDADDVGQRAITPEQWKATGIEVAPDGVKAFAVAFSVDGSRLALGGSIKHDEGAHVELVDAFEGSVEDGLAPLADWLAARWRDVSTIVLSGKAGAGVLAQLLRERKVPASVIQVVNTPQFFQACAMFLDGIRQSASNEDLEDDATPFVVTHLATEGQAVLDNSVATCDKKSRGVEGSWSWFPTTPDGDETPLEAVSLALWAAKTTRRKPRGDTERRGAMVL